MASEYIGYTAVPDDAEFKRIIYAHFNEAGRQFPWRETNDPYAILVSEMMLQQTQTLRVLPKYEAWLKRFPSVQDLAKASLQEVLQFWSGLGYNRRAVFLQKTCKALLSDFGGEFPRDVALLEKLPGIGPYTARAVSTFAYNQPEVFIETNIRSVFIYFFFKDATEKVSDSVLMPFVERTLDREQPRLWYYALMDYGAELKKHIVNPSRRSTGYTKQSTFKGSLRQARGAILRQLAMQPDLTLDVIGKMESIDAERLQKAASKLVQEGLICSDTEGRYRISS